MSKQEPRPTSSTTSSSSPSHSRMNTPSVAGLEQQQQHSIHSVVPAVSGVEQGMGRMSLSGEQGVVEQQQQLAEQGEWSAPCRDDSGWAGMGREKEQGVQYMVQRALTWSATGRLWLCRRVGLMRGCGAWFDEAQLPCA